MLTHLSTYHLTPLVQVQWHVTSGEPSLCRIIQDPQLSWVQYFHKPITRRVQGGQRSKYNKESHLAQHNYQTYSQDMIILILATDMARHAEILENFKQKLDNFDYSSEDHLNTLKMILIKACDISNECRPLLVRAIPIPCFLHCLYLFSPGVWGLAGMLAGRIFQPIRLGENKWAAICSIHGQV